VAAIDTFVYVEGAETNSSGTGERWIRLRVENSHFSDPDNHKLQWVTLKFDPASGLSGEALPLILDPTKHYTLTLEEVV
jgi:hypothetical protein